ncbi:MAG: primase-helicase family protein [Alkalilacustris sp.]
MEKGILKTAGDVSTEEILAAIESGEEHPVLTALSPTPSEWVWWALSQRDIRNSAAGTGDGQVDDVMETLRERFVYGAFRDEVFDRRAGDWISTRAMDNVMARHMPLDWFGRPMSAFSTFKADQKTQMVHNEKYRPGERREIFVDGKGTSWLNTWTPPSVKAKKGDATPLLNHILYLCNGDKAHAAHIADWLAYMYQNPGAKLNHAILMVSEHQGVGKDTLGEAMARILGQDNVRLVQDDDVNEGRNDFMKRSQLVIVPETMSGDRRDLANKLKPLITQPIIRVNEKNVKPYEIENTVNFLMFSNHLNAAYIEDHDRRYFVIVCGEKPKPVEYYEDLHAYINGPDIAGFAHFLATRDLSKFNPKAPAPYTEHKRTIQRATRGGVEAWLDEVWEDLAHPLDRDVVNLRQAHTAIAEMKGPRMTIQQLAAFLKKKGGGDLGVRRVEGSNMRLWAVRDFDAISQLKGRDLENAMRIIPTDGRGNVVDMDEVKRQVRMS